MISPFYGCFVSRFPENLGVFKLCLLTNGLNHHAFILTSTIFTINNNKFGFTFKFAVLILSRIYSSVLFCQTFVLPGFWWLGFVIDVNCCSHDINIHVFQI